MKEGPVGPRGCWEAEHPFLAEFAFIITDTPGQMLLESLVEIFPVPKDSLVAPEEVVKGPCELW